MPYVQRKFYFPEELYVALQIQARQEGIRIVDKLRRYTERGIQEDRRRKGKSGAAKLLALARRAEREGWGKGAPRDLSIHHNKYFVQAYEELKEGKKRTEA